MEEVFDKLKKAGQNDVENLVKWMKDSKVIDSKAAEDKARELFKDVADKKSVDVLKFKDTLAKLATDQKKNVEDFTKILVQEAPRVLLGAAVSLGAGALKDAFTKNSVRLSDSRNASSVEVQHESEEEQEEAGSEHSEEVLYSSVDDH